MAVARAKAGELARRNKYSGESVMTVSKPLPVTIKLTENTKDDY